VKGCNHSFSKEPSKDKEYSMARQKLQCRQVESDGNGERQLVSQSVLEIQGSDDENDPLAWAEMVLVGAAFVGPNVDRLVQLTGYSREYVDQNRDAASSLGPVEGNYA
jgi:hypothetical protein